MTELSSILSELGLPTSPRESSVPRAVVKSRLLELMGTDDLEALGAIYAFLNSESSKMVEPPLAFPEYHAFFLHYYEMCLIENPQGHWSDTRYSAGWDLVNWFAALWRDRSVPRQALGDIKSMLARLYQRGDLELRTCIVTAMLEHLFEQVPIRKFFDDWKDNPTLASAHRQAMQWVQGGEESPLGKSRRLTKSTGRKSR
jgi:hypothetical protein